MPTVYLVDRRNAEGLHFECRQDESFHQAATRAGLVLPLSCKNGICEVCRATLRQGKAWQGNATKALKEGSENKPEEILLCRSGPINDCKIEVEKVLMPGELPVKNLACQIEDVSELKNHVYRVRLLAPAGKLPEFYAGQYLSLDLPGREEAHYFSIASAPNQRQIELHIQADPHIAAAVETIQFLKQERLVRVSLPFGKSCLTALPSQPIILIAAGTGFAQMKSIIESLWQSDFAQPVHLYWGVRKESDLYAHALVDSWAATHENFFFHTVCGASKDEQGTEHHDVLVNAIMQDGLPFADAKVFVSGSPKLVFSMQNRLRDLGVPNDAFFSDVLEYAKAEDFGF